MNNRKTAKKMINQMARQSLRTSRMRNCFVMVTIALASALLAGILSFAMGQEEQNRKELSHRQQVGYYNLSGKQVDLLKRDERIAFQIQVKTGVLTELEGFDIMPLYVSEMSDQIRIGELESGRLPEREDEVAVCAAMLRRMGVEPELGNQVTFPFYDGNEETFVISGILAGDDAAKQFSVLFSQSYAEHGSQLANQPYEVYAKLYGTAQMSAWECREVMYLIGQESGIARKYVSPSKAFLDSLSPDIQTLMLCGLVGTVILVASILVIYGVFYLSVIGRIHQFGQLRTIGMTQKQMKKMVSREGGLLFLCAAPVGIAVGVAVGYGLIPDGFCVGSMVLTIALVFGIIYAITMISIRKPARIAAAVSPMEALRYMPQDGVKQAAGRKLCRRLTPMGLAIMYFSKNKKKAAITMLSLAFGGILFMTAATYMSSFHKENYARQGYFLNAQFNIYYTQAAASLNENGISGLQAQSPMDGEMVEAIYALQGVENVEQIKSFGVSFDVPQRDEYNHQDMIYPLTDEEIEGIGKYLENGSADYEKLLTGDYVLAAGNSTVQEIYGWQFEPGDRITLHYYDGSKMAEREVVVLGILNQQFVLDQNGLEGWFLMPEQAILGLIDYDSLNAHLLVAVDETQETAVGEALAQMVAERSELGLETLAERREVYARNADQMFGVISGLAILIMMFSILSMINTLITNIVTRKQELAMLESMGMSREQIRRMLLGESLFLVLAAVGVTLTVGTLCGYTLSRMLYQNGAFYMAFRFPTGLSLCYGGVLTLVPILITLITMHYFAKDALVERLRGTENE